MSKENEVKKALSQEEMTIFSNIQSLIQELVTMSPAPAAIPVKEGATAAPIVEKKREDIGMTEEEQKKQIEGEGKKKEAAKALENTPGEGPNASTPAKNQIDENLPEETLGQVNALAKAIAGMLVKKEIAPPVDPIVGAISGMTQVMKSIADRQNELENAITNLLKASGIADQMNIAQKSIDAQVAAGKPIINSGNEEMAKYLQSLISGVVKKDENANMSNSQIVNKNLSQPQILAAMTGFPIPK